MEGTTTDKERILVGVDGSPGSKAALAWAAAEARASGRGLEVVWAWEMPASYGWPVAWPMTDFTADIEKALSELIAEVLGPDHGIDVEQLVVEGHPAHVLSERSRSAPLVVVGSRGFGSFKGMLLGSVSAHLAHHCHSTLVIVRSEELERQATS